MRTTEWFPGTCNPVRVGWYACVTLPVKILSEANNFDGWRKKATRKKAQRAAASQALGGDIRGPKPPYAITLTRIGPKKLDDDNLASGFKAVRDGVADWLGIDDGDKRLFWRYAQRKGKPKEYAAEILIEAVCAPDEALKVVAVAIHG